MFKAAILDHDGLMIDSEPIQSRSFAAVIREYGKKPIVRDSGIIQIAGMRTGENWEEIMKTHGFREDVETLIRKKDAIYPQLLRTNVIMQPGLMELLELLRTHQIKIAIGSSGEPGNINIALEVLDIRDYFEAIISGRTIKRGKPFPDTFLKAAAELGVEPEYCVVFEDAELGVIAGKAAGMKVIAVPNRYTADQDFSAADLVVPSLEEVTWEKLNRLADAE